MNQNLSTPNRSSDRLRRLLLAVVTTVALGTAGLQAASFRSLAQRLPPSTDAVVAINVEKVLNSPYAQQQRWRETAAENWAKRPQIVPPGVTRLVMGAEFLPSKAETRWEVTLMELQQMPSLQDLNQVEGGVIDRVWDKDAVASPINAYFIPLEANVLAVVTPGERSAIARWVRMPLKEEGSVTSEYINGVLSDLNDSTDVVMALDLVDAFGVPRIRRFLDNCEIPALEGKDLDALTQTIASLRGIRLQVRVDQDVSGTVRISFAKDAASLADVAKPLMAAVLNAAGMHLDDVEQWTFEAAGNEVTGTGKLSDASLRQLVGVVQSPVPAIVAAGPQRSAAAADPAAASQRYFKTVSLILDNLSRGGSVQQTGTWFAQSAGRIDRLPILNVDPALVEWGTLVSTKLKQVAAVARGGQTQIDARVAGVADPDYANYYYDPEGNYHKGDAYEDVRRQRRQAALEQRSQVEQQALQIINEVIGSRQRVRADMTAKYKVEF